MSNVSELTVRTWSATAAHTFWESREAIRAFAGEDITVAIVEPEARAMLLDFDRSATHRGVVTDARADRRRPGGR